MTVTVKSKADLVVPPSVQRRAGIKSGDTLEFKVHGSVITITPRSCSAGAEYTASQRRDIDGQLDEAEKGPFRGPFSTAERAIADMKSQLKVRPGLKKAKRPR